FSVASVASVGKDARRVPGVVGAAGEVVAEIAVRTADRAPVARGVPPGIYTREGRLKHVLAADNPPPRLGDHFGHPADGLTHLALQTAGSGNDVGVMLPAHIRLQGAMALSMTKKCRVAVAVHAARLFGVL